MSNQYPFTLKPSECRAVGCEIDDGGDNEVAFKTDLEPHRAEGSELGSGEGVKGKLKKKWQYWKNEVDAPQAVLSIVTPHAQRERGKVIGCSVHIYIYM